MKIDKSRFLALTGAIAAATMVSVGAAGCVIKTADDKESPADNKDAGNTPEADAGPEDDADAGPKEDASTDSDGSTDAETPACLDDTGPEANCEVLPTSCAEACENMLFVDWGLKNGVMLDMIDCLTGLPTCVDEDGGPSKAAWECRDEAAKKACVTDSDKALCETLVDNCWEVSAGMFSEEFCEITAGAIREDLHENLVDCVTEGVDGYCTPDPMWCLLSIEDDRVWD